MTDPRPRRPIRLRRLLGWTASFIGFSLLAACAAKQAGPPPQVAEAQKVGATRFVVFDVGQANALLVVHNGRTLLMDIGAASNRADRDDFHHVASRIQQLTGRRQLDYLVVSHYHADHIGWRRAGPKPKGSETGLWGLLNDEGVTVDTLIDRGSVTYGEKGNTQRAYEDWVPKWLQRGTVAQHRSVQAGDLIDLGQGLRIEVVVANSNGRLPHLREIDPAGFAQWPPSENDYSIGLKFTSGDFELFVAGDLSGENVRKQYGDTQLSYHDIESTIAGAVGPLEVYLVDHHGSEHSSNSCFVSVLHPQVSIFSTGENHYGHPALAVFERLRALGDPYVTGGADHHVYGKVKRFIAFDDVEVVVAPDGGHFYVGSKEYRALTEAEERARPDTVSDCRVEEPRALETGPDDPDAD
jgi:beta-lactamase superfamily II metal-dependent hydrolase